jgi:hypothetical protein
MASSSEERMLAVQNAEAVLKHSKQFSTLVSKELIENMVESLASPSIRSFRIRQLTSFEEDRKMQRPSDFVAEDNELQLLGRLYYSAIKACRGCLLCVGLSLDHAGFTILLAMCRAAITCDEFQLMYNSIDAQNIGMKLDAVISDHFNAITAPGCRFLFSPRHGLDKADLNGPRSKRLIIAFSSLGNGLVRFEFGGSLATLNRLIYAKSKDNTFDVLFVADPSQSWYQKDSRGNFNGFNEYERRLRIASRPYSHISIVGDSMGGSAALLFAHLATDSIVAFSPQVNLHGDQHVSRNDLNETTRDLFQPSLLNCAHRSIKDGVMIFIHRGAEGSDVRHTDELMEKLSYLGVFESNQLNRSVLKNAAGRIEVIEHIDCSHHQIAVHLKEKGQLVHELSVLIQ